jgi:hypothetical protein
LKQATIKRLIAQLATTAIASPILMLLAYEAGRSRLEWLQAPFTAPGLWVADMVFQGGDHSLLFLQTAFALNFVFIWIALLLALKLIERSINRSKLKAAN